MGATLTQHLSLPRGRSHVGIYDMLRCELYPNGAFNVTSSARTRSEQFRASTRTRRWSRRRRHGVSRVMMFSGTNDSARQSGGLTQVHGPPPGGQTHQITPILLRISESGHRLGTSLSEGLAQTADQYAFVFCSSGMKVSLR